MLVGELLVVVVPAAIGAAGSIVSAYIAVKVRQVAIQTDGRLTALETELRLARLLLEDAERREVDSRRST